MYSIKGLNQQGAQTFKNAIASTVGYYKSITPSENSGQSNAIGNATPLTLEKWRDSLESKSLVVCYKAIPSIILRLIQATHKAITCPRERAA